MSDTQREGVVTLIPKPKKDHFKVTNFRPITLLNVDYKIVSKIMTERFKKLLPTLIHPDQNGFQKGKLIGNNIRLLFDVIDYADYKDILGAILSLDFEKAFDSISWDFIEQILELYNIGPNLIAWFKVLYSKPICVITNNNYLSTTFSVERGVQQGDPLSPSLFLLAIEWLACALRQNAFKGISVGETEVKVSVLRSGRMAQ